MEQRNPFSQIRARGCVDYMLRSAQQHHVQLSAMADDGKVYETIVNEIYQMGQLLHHRKYRFLGYSYRLFLTGILLGSCAWLIEFWLR
jgi:hypothetical protein